MTHAQKCHHHCLPEMTFKVENNPFGYSKLFILKNKFDRDAYRKDSETKTVTVLDTKFKNKEATEEFLMSS